MNKNILQEEESLFQSFFFFSLRAPDTHHHSHNVMIIRAFSFVKPGLIVNQHHRVEKKKEMDPCRL